jgi:DNA polymerase I-like protein with 3'-5' exonuclease and polymerase domains
VANLKRLQEIMENCIKLRVPVIAEPEVGPNWYDVEELDEAVAKEKIC